MNLTNLINYFEVSPAKQPAELAVQAVLLVFLASILGLVYILQGNSLSNRSRLAMIFPLMSLTTMLIIIVVKSSLALSLGLVGALSIVRFRAAIKDPEELTYIFLAIAIGLGFGATQITITTSFFIFALVVIVGQNFFSKRFGKKFVFDNDLMQLQVTFTKQQSFSKVEQLLNDHTSELQLSKFDDGDQQTMLFLVKPKNDQSLDAIKSAVEKLDAKAHFTVFRYQPIV